MDHGDRSVWSDGGAGDEEVGGDEVRDEACGEYHGRILRPSLARAGGLGSAGAGDEDAAGDRDGVVADEVDASGDEEMDQVMGPRWVQGDGWEVAAAGGAAGVGGRRGGAGRHGGAGGSDGETNLRFDGRGAVFLPFLGLYGANQLSVTWRARLECWSASCGPQIMWSMHTIKGWMVRAEVSPAPPPDAHTRFRGPGGVATGMVWAEVVMQRHPFLHVLASVGIPEGVLRLRGGVPQGRVTRWIKFVLSLSSLASEPVLFSVTVLAREGDQDRVVWSSGDLRGAAAARWGEKREGGAIEEEEDHEEEEEEEEEELREPAPCLYSQAMDRTFIHGCCAPLTPTVVEKGAQEQRHDASTPLPRATDCPLYYESLSAAVVNCNRRAGCGGVTFSPRTGRFELRRSTAGQVHVGQSGIEGEVSWIKQMRPTSQGSHGADQPWAPPESGDEGKSSGSTPAAMCSGHIAVVPPERCATYSSPPQGARMCNRWGANLPFRFASGCTSRAFLIDASGRPVTSERVHRGGEEVEVYRDSLGNRWTRQGSGPHDWSWQLEDEDMRDGDGSSAGPRATGADMRAQFAELNWIISLQGCSNDFWILHNDGIAGVWLGCGDSDERSTFRGQLADFAIWNVYWGLESTGAPSENAFPGDLTRNARCGLGGLSQHIGQPPAPAGAREGTGRGANEGAGACIHDASESLGQEGDDVARADAGRGDNGAPDCRRKAKETAGAPRDTSAPASAAWKEIQVDVLWPKAFENVDVEELLAGSLRYRVTLPPGYGDEVHLEVLFNNNVAGFQPLFVPDAAGYEHVVDGSWPMTHLRNFDAGDAEEYAQQALDPDTFVPKALAGWCALEVRAVTDAGRPLTSRVVFLKLQQRSLSARVMRAAHTPGVDGEKAVASAVVAWTLSHAARVRASGCTPRTPGDAVQYAVELLGVRSVLDLGAGDLAWLPPAVLLLREVLVAPGERVEYMAVDIAGEALGPWLPRDLFGDGSVVSLRYQQADVTRSSSLLLPHPPAHRDGQQPDAPDLVICRGLLQHLPLADAVQLFLRVARSGASYALFSSSPGAGSNADAFLLDHARYRPLDLRLPPFLPSEVQPLRTWPDNECADLVPEGGGWLGLSAQQELLLIDLDPLRRLVINE